MTRLPGVYPEILDGGLGIVAPSGDGQRVVIGVSSAGDTLTLVALTDVTTVRTLLGAGPLTDAVADQLSLGGGIVYAVRVPGSVAGAVAPAAGNPAAPAVTLDGAPDRALDVLVTITKGGAVGTSEFTYSLDGGDTVVGPIAVAASYAIPGTAHTLTFAAGNYVQGSVYAYAVSAPQASIADIQAGIRAAFDSPALFEYVHVAQPMDNSGWAALDSLMVEAENEFRYVWAIAEAPGPNAGESVDQWVTRLEAMKAGFASNHVQIVAPYAEVVDNLSGQQQVRSLGSRMGARLSSSPVHENPGWVQQGPVPGVVTIAPFKAGTFGKQTLWNNGHALRLEQAGYSVVYNLAGRAGWFWTDGRMAAAPTSDYKSVTNRRVMNKGVTQVRQALLDFVQSDVDTSELDASLANLVARAQAPLQAMFANGEIDTYRVVIPAGQNVLSTRHLTVQVRITPKGYLREISLDIGFRNPFLEALA